ncbi:hypothetical protein SPURM210S_06998 [Streptomyces purpurascens]
MVAACAWKAALMSASCWTQAGYWVAERPAQMGSPMIRTRRPEGWASANARSTPGMIRPGLRPASCMSMSFHGARGIAQGVPDQREVLAGHRDRHGLAGRQAVAHEGHGDVEVLLLVPVEERGVDEGVEGPEGLGHGRAHDVDTSIPAWSGDSRSRVRRRAGGGLGADEPAAVPELPGRGRERTGARDVDERHVGQLQVVHVLILANSLLQYAFPDRTGRQADFSRRPDPLPPGRRSTARPGTRGPAAGT